MNLGKLYILNKYIDFVKKVSGIQDIFCVGGSIRDIILEKNKKTDEIHDIDVTGPFEPETFWKNISKDTNKISIFRTEKYGTMTIIPKENNQTQYEITPFRTEGKYSDNRRPDNVSWSENLLEDAKRRDFSINSMFYFFDGEIETPNLTEFNIETKKLSNLGINFFPSIKICIVQDEKIISKLFSKQKTSNPHFFDRTFFQELLNKHCFKDKISKDEQKYKNRGFLIDPNYGLQSIENKKLTSVGNPDDRIQEDALRIIRALRFSQVLGFDFDKSLRNSIKKHFYLVKTLPKERLKIEVDKVAKKGSLFGFVSLCDELNISKTLFPSLFATKNIDQPVRYHPFDVYAHTMLVLWHLEKLLKEKKTDIEQTYLLKRAALFHDVGKVDQYYSYSLLEKDEQHKIPELDHRNSSSVSMNNDLSKLNFSKKELTEIKWYVDNHHKPYEGIIASKTSNHKNKLRKLYSEGGYQRTKNLLILTQADILGQYNPIQNENILLTDYLFDMLEQLKNEEGQFTMKKLAVNGNRVMKKFKIEPGKQLGELLNKIFLRVMNDTKQRNNIREITVYTRDLLENTKN